MQYLKAPRPRNQRIRRALIVVLPVCLLLYALLLEPNWLEVTHHDISSSGGSPVRVALLTDLHLSGIGYLERRVIEELRRAEPDVLVLGGDVLDHPDNLQAVQALVGQIAVPHIVAVLGNWEHWGDVPLERLKAIYQGANVTLLVDATAPIQIRGRRVQLVGLDDATASKPRLERAARDGEAIESEISILVQHSPGFFAENSTRRELEGKRFDLCLSGHTHGGQITLFGWAFGPMPPGSGRYVAGWYETTACPLYVSRGLGTSLLPVRFMARPELALFDL